jgi:predicted Zn finger-like uncharacterized protein
MLEASRPMHVVCGHCAETYSISEEKLAGRVVQIRCKRCSAAILVDGSRPTVAQPVTPAREAETPVVRSAVANGPASSGSAAARITAPEVNRETAPSWSTPIPSMSVHPTQNRLTPIPRLQSSLGATDDDSDATGLPLSDAEAGLASNGSAAGNTGRTPAGGSAFPWLRPSPLRPNLEGVAAAPDPNLYDEALDTVAMSQRELLGAAHRSTRQRRSMVLPSERPAAMPGGSPTSDAGGGLPSPWLLVLVGVLLSVGLSLLTQTGRHWAARQLGLIKTQESAPTSSVLTGVEAPKEPPRAPRGQSE